MFGVHQHLCGTEENLVHRCPEKLRIQIVGDWSRCSRGSFWRGILDDPDERRPVPNAIHTYPLADRVWHAAPRNCRQHVIPVPHRPLLQYLDTCDVLVLNWDVASGDPDFGADLAMRWFAKRPQKSCIGSESAGGSSLLKVKQALGVPAQDSYDGLLGLSQVEVCGPEGALRPRRNFERNGTLFKVTRAAWAPASFDHLRLLGDQGTIIR
jgi:hypothetical protein